MSDKFLLPCTCGQNVIVEQRQAGTSVKCTCGNSLDVPTIRGFAQLARAEVVEEPLPPIWTLRHGIVFLGLALALPSFAFAIYLYTRLPTLQESNIEEFVTSLSPANAWEVWRYYANGLPKTPSLETKAIIEGINTLNRWINVGLVLGVLGLLVSAAAFFAPIQNANRRTRDKKASPQQSKHRT